MNCWSGLNANRREYNPSYVVRFEHNEKPLVMLTGSIPENIYSSIYMGLMTSNCGHLSPHQLGVENFLRSHYEVKNPSVTGFYYTTVRLWNLAGSCILIFTEWKSVTSLAYVESYQFTFSTDFLTTHQFAAMSVQITRCWFNHVSRRRTANLRGKHGEVDSWRFDFKWFELICRCCLNLVSTVCGDFIWTGITSLCEVTVDRPAWNVCVLHDTASSLAAGFTELVTRNKDSRWYSKFLSNSPTIYLNLAWFAERRGVKIASVALFLGSDGAGQNII